MGVMVMVMAYSRPYASPVPPNYLTGSFGPVPPMWISYTRSAVPHVEGHTRPPPPVDARRDAHFVVPRVRTPRARKRSRCCII